MNRDCAILIALSVCGCDDRAPAGRFPPRDRVTPALTARCPEPGGTLDGCPDGAASVEFSDLMDEASVAAGFRLFDKDKGTPVEGKVAYETRKDDLQLTTVSAARFIPALLQPGRDYTAVLDGVSDRGGNALPAAAWSFASGAGSEMVASTPYDGEMGVGKRPRIFLFFTRALRSDEELQVDPGSFAFTAAGGRAVAAGYSWVPRLNAVRVEIFDPLAAGVEHTLDIRTTLADFAGRALVAPATVRFVVSAGEDATPPAPPTEFFPESSDETGFHLRWDPSSDDATPQDRLRYRIFLSTQRDREAPLAFAETAPGAAAYLLAAPSGVFAVLRAVDEAGNESDPAGPAELRQ